MHTTDFTLISTLTIKQFLAMEDVYKIRLPRKFKKYFKREIDRKSMHIMAHDFIHQLGGI